MIYEYKGYIKISENFTGEIALGPKHNIKKWMSNIKNSFSNENLKFKQLILNNEDIDFVDSKC